MPRDERDAVSLVKVLMFLIDALNLILLKAIEQLKGLRKRLEISVEAISRFNLNPSGPFSSPSCSELSTRYGGACGTTCVMAWKSLVFEELLLPCFADQAPPEPHWNTPQIDTNQFFWDSSTGDDVPSSDSTNSQHLGISKTQRRYGYESWVMLP